MEITDWIVAMSALVTSLGVVVGIIFYLQRWIRRMVRDESEPIEEMVILELKRIGSECQAILAEVKSDIAAELAKQRKEAETRAAAQQAEFARQQKEAETRAAAQQAEFARQQKEAADRVAAQQAEFARLAKEAAAEVATQAATQAAAQAAEEVLRKYTSRDDASK